MGNANTNTNASLSHRVRGANTNTNACENDADNGTTEAKPSTTAETNCGMASLDGRSGLLVVDLTLLDVSKQVGDDPRATTLLENIQCGGMWETACSAHTFLTGSSSTTQEARDVQKRISRFLKTQDKYLACASVLFQSRAFHERYNEDALPKSSSPKRNRPVVTLPRTDYRKPYIPVCSFHGKRETTNSMVKEEDVFSMSISHQFPFCGLAKIIHNDPQQQHGQQHGQQQVWAPGQHMSTRIVGLDIVVFEGFNPRLYESQDEFLEVFRDSFAPKEWQWGIQNPQLPPAVRLREFYLRWAMKEAYTKAIGVGMGLDFTSFEIHLEGTNDNGNGTSSTPPIAASIWNRILLLTSKEEESTTPKGFRGRIVFPHQPELDDEYFWFYFLPLVSHGEDGEATEGCACVCVGPLPEWHPRVKVGADVPVDDPPSTLHCSWTEFEELVESHANL